MVMERRATLLYHYVTGRKKMPENVITLQNTDNLRRSGRLCHGLELTMPHTQFEVVKSSSMNVARRLWNALPADVV